MEALSLPASAAAKSLKGPRACSTCARAKSRCIPGPVGQLRCERCHRLRKPCSSQTPAPPRKRKEPKPTRVAELERRLEDLTARIESVQKLGPAVPSPPESDRHDPSPRQFEQPNDQEPPRTLSGTREPIPTFGRNKWKESPFGHLFPDESIFDVHPIHQQPISADPAAGVVSPPSAPLGLTPTQPVMTAGPARLSPPPYQPPPPSRSTPAKRSEQPLWPEDGEAELFLDEYKAHLARLFPFATMPSNITSAQLREQRPLFWKSVMMKVCFEDGPRQIAMGNQLLKDISEAAFVKPQKNLDLLQGLQMLISWFNYNLNSFQMVNLLFLARSITSSLGAADLDRLPDDGREASECLERMRAFIGTYYLITITFTTNKRLDALMNTTYLAACCRALHSRMEYPTDELAVHLVRTQQLSQTISQGLARRKALPIDKQIPQAAFAQGLEERIRTFAATLPPHIRTNASLSGHLHIACILVHEDSLQEIPAAQQGQMMAADPMAQPDPARLERLWCCARAVLNFMTHRFIEEKGEHPRFTCLASFDLTYAFLIMLKLVTLQLPGWDLARVREELRFDDFVSRLTNDMERAAQQRLRGKGDQGGSSGGSSNQTSPENSNNNAMANDGGAPTLEVMEDAWAKVARKLRTLKDHILIHGVDSTYASSQVARVYDPAPMTLADATQDLMQDLGSGLWQDAALAGAGAAPGQQGQQQQPGADGAGGGGAWAPFYVGDIFDWATVFGGGGQGGGVVEPGFA